MCQFLLTELPDPSRAVTSVSFGITALPSTPSPGIWGGGGGDQGIQSRQQRARCRPLRSLPTHRGVPAPTLAPERAPARRVT